MERLNQLQKESIVTHFICAVDTDHVTRIWSSLKEIFLKKAVASAMNMMS